VEGERHVDHRHPRRPRPALARRRLIKRLSCPVCERRLRRFADAHGRPGARCPGCGSLERHRHLWLYLERELGITGAALDVLHVAPDPGIDARMASLANLGYVSGDLLEGRGALRIDLLDLAFGDASFDLVIAFHVLEHVPDDARAFEEIARVLRPSGSALLQVPLRDGPTLEDPSVDTPDARLARFGQEDHVRLYGDDFPDRIAAAGLEPEPVVYEVPDRGRFGIPDDPRFWSFVRARAHQ
jgi:SAM-dependent methyltransferase